MRGLTHTYALKSAMHVPLLVYEMTKCSTNLVRSLVAKKTFDNSEVEFFTQTVKKSELALNSVHSK